MSQYLARLIHRPTILLLMLVPILLLLAACGGSSNGDVGESDTDLGVDLAPQQAEDIESEAPPADALYAEIANTTDGKELYETLCSKCHGLEGLGDGPSLGSLNVQGNMVLQGLDDRSDEELLEIITYGKGVDMPAWGLILTSEQRQSVLDYARTLDD